MRVSSLQASEKAHEILVGYPHERSSLSEVAPSEWLKAEAHVDEESIILPTMWTVEPQASNEEGSTSWSRFESVVNKALAYNIVSRNKVRAHAVTKCGGRVARGISR